MDSILAAWYAKKSFPSSVQSRVEVHFVPSRSLPSMGQLLYRSRPICKKVAMQQHNGQDKRSFKSRPPTLEKPRSDFICAWRDFKFRLCCPLCCSVKRLFCKWGDFCKLLLVCIINSKYSLPLRGRLLACSLGSLSSLSLFLLLSSSFFVFDLRQTFRNQLHWEKVHGSLTCETNFLTHCFSRLSQGRSGGIGGVSREVFRYVPTNENKSRDASGRSLEVPRQLFRPSGVGNT